jgi:hypothetical protein
MKMYIQASIIGFLLVVLGSTHATAQGGRAIPGLPTIPGGNTFQRENVTFIEDKIIKFNSIEIPKDSFQRLITDFAGPQISSSERKAIAGFCFIPIQQKSESSGNTIHFSTIGYRVALTLWKVRKDRVLEMYFHGYRNNFMGVFDPNYRASSKVFEVKFTAANARASTSIINNPSDSLLILSREMDLAYLDFETYRQLAESTRYYPNGDRRGEGIVIMRSVNSIMVDSSDYFKGDYLRGLIARPFPLPELNAFPSEASVMYSFLELCPPYWHEDREESSKTRIYHRLVQLGDESLSAAMARAQTIRNPWDNWWFWILAVLSLIGILLFLSVILFPRFRLIDWLREILGVTRDGRQRPDFKNNEDSNLTNQ